LDLYNSSKKFCFEKEWEGRESDEGIGEAGMGRKKSPQVAYHAMPLIYAVTYISHQDVTVSQDNLIDSFKISLFY